MLIHDLRHPLRQYPPRLRRVLYPILAFWLLLPAIAAGGLAGIITSQDDNGVRVLVTTVRLATFAVFFILILMALAFLAYGRWQYRTRGVTHNACGVCGYTLAADQAVVRCSECGTPYVCDALSKYNAAIFRSSEALLEPGLRRRLIQAGLSYYAGPLALVYVSFCLPLLMWSIRTPGGVPLFDGVILPLLMALFSGAVLYVPKRAILRRALCGYDPACEAATGGEVSFPWLKVMWKRNPLRKEVSPELYRELRPIYAPHWQEDVIIPSRRAWEALEQRRSVTANSDGIPPATSPTNRA
jgi:hypothetical protein